MALLLKTRFLKSISPFHFYLKTIGIFHRLPNSPLKWKEFACLILSFACFTITFQAGLYVFFERTALNIRYAFSGFDSRGGVNSSKIFSRMDALSSSIHVMNSFLIGSITSLLLIATSPTTIRLFCVSLERMNRLSKQPDLASLRRYSIAAVTWIAITVNWHGGFYVYWIFRDINWLSKNWRFSTEMLILTVQSQNYTLSAAWIYTLCARTIVIYYLHVADELQRLAERDYYCLDEIVRYVKMYKHLSQTTCLLHRRLQLILLMNCYYHVTDMIYLMYYVTRYNNVDGFLISIGDWFLLVESMCRLLLICHSTDSIRNSRLESISILRQLRDDSTFITKSADRMKLTLFIIELHNCEKDITLLGMMQLSKRIILKAVETALTFYIIIYQFQIGWSQLPAE